MNCEESWYLISIDSIARTISQDRFLATELQLIFLFFLIEFFFFESANVENKSKCHTQPYSSL